MLALMASLAVALLRGAVRDPVHRHDPHLGSDPVRRRSAPLQSRVVDHASEAPNLAATLNQGAFNLGNAAGASLGGILITAGYSYRSLPIASIGVTVVTLALAALAIHHERRGKLATAIAL